MSKIKHFLIRMFLPKKVKLFFLEYKTETGLVLFGVAFILHAFGIEIPTEIWNIIAIVTGLGVAHNGIKINKKIEQVKKEINAEK